MKKKIWLCLSFASLAGIFYFPSKAYSQVSKDGSQSRVVVDIKLKDGKQLHVNTEDAQKIREAIKPTIPPRNTDASSLRLIEDLVNQFRLNTKTVQNPHLVFGDNEVAYWFGRKLDHANLKLEFLARRIILDVADKQNVAIRDQDMLSDIASQIISTLTIDGPLTQVICKGNTSQELIKQAWAALEAGKGGMGHNNFEMALACTGVVIDKWGDDADEQQVKRQNAGDCKTTPIAAEKDAYFRDYWALSDIATAWFIRGQAYKNLKRCTEAKESFAVLIKKYNCAYTWDPQGWFWNTARGATQESRYCP